MTYVFLAVLLASAPVPAVESPEELAEKSALAWLALVDAGNYQESWKQAAKLLRDAITIEEWEKGLSAARRPLGPLVSRKAKSRTYAESLPGAPDGKYVVLQFDASFESKKNGIETVTPMLEADGTWRVSGYYVR